MWRVTQLALLLLHVAMLPCCAAATLYAAQRSLADTVHHWLHWGANAHDARAAAPAPHPRATGGGGGGSGAAAARLPAWVVGAGSGDGGGALDDDGASGVAYETQMMHRAEVDLVMAYLRPTDVFVEWGGGGSSVRFGERVKRAYSLEHDCEWAAYVQARAQGVQVRCVPVRRGDRGWGTMSPVEHGNYEQFREYVDEVERLPDKLFDKVLIDGRARVACALKVLPHLHDDSLVFIHDFYARVAHYRPLLAHYTEVGRILAHRNTDATQGPIDEPQGLLVLRRAANATFPLPAAAIHAAYAGDAWRAPHGPPPASARARMRRWAAVATDGGRWRRARNAHMLVALVRADLLRLALAYGVAMFLARNWRVLAAAAGTGAGEVARRVARVTARMTARGTVWVTARVAARVAERVAGRSGARVAEGDAPAARAEAMVVQRRETEEAEAEGRRKGTRRTGSVPRFVETEAMKAASARRKVKEAKEAREAEARDVREGGKGNE